MNGPCRKRTSVGALYFALAAVPHRFEDPKQALAILSVFIGSKVFVADLFGWAKFPAESSLRITFAALGAGVLPSLWPTRGSAVAAVQGEPQVK